MWLILLTNLLNLRQKCKLLAKIVIFFLPNVNEDRLKERVGFSGSVIIEEKMTYQS